MTTWRGLKWFGESGLEGVALMTLSCAVVLCGALLVERALRGRVSAGVLIVLYAAVFVRALMPAHYSFGGTSVIDGGALGEIARGVSASTIVGASSAQWLASVHLLGVVVLGLHWLVRSWLFRRSLRDAVPSGRSIAGAPIVVHPHLGPAVAGIVRQRIVVPAALWREPSDMEIVLRHEGAHVQRHDAWVAFALRALTILFWPLLPLWIARHRMHELMEIACDERALHGRSADERRRYGELLISMADTQSPSFELSFYRSLRRRVLALRVSAKAWPRFAQHAAVAACLTLALACSANDVRSKRITMDLRSATVGNVARLLTEVSAHDIRVGDDDGNRQITVNVSAMPWREVLDVVASASDLVVVAQDDGYRLVKP